MSERTCPDCKGSRKMFVHLNTTDPRTHGFKWVDCLTCAGRGAITEQHAARIAEGKRLRDDRRGRGVSLRAEAERLGITLRELCDLENGREASHG